MDHQKMLYTSALLGDGVYPKSQKMDNEKIVYTYGRWFLPKKYKNGPQKIVYTSGELIFSSKDKNNHIKIV